ncbi:uncharacterized protein YbjT (DUF2867 family) [Solirubrobacter pauli]|uniref:Uncharacterized protein YbjT (DUF2867 family) n=1 Tax=Solirubrobacter pauli TaxID=166793 RepID=A0A660KYH0_9ACTN|nr:SDR family oxidoreductase [Solirubrobacter pauli]RKQ86747.1 uncharacterized protein YbjT (DUF2867 family) [Solirubrobacter pauli]
MIVITGANGQLGRAIADRLPADQLAVSVRDPAAAEDLAARGVRVRRGDFTEPDTLLDAFAGADQVLIISAAAVGDEAERRHRAAIDAAVRAGARRILYTSHMGANPASPFPPMPSHATSERLLEASGVPFTALRNGFYAASAPLFMGNAVETGRLVAPADGPVSWTAHADLAAAAARILTDGGFDGSTPPLTATEALDFADLAELASDIHGTPIERVVVSDEAYAASMRERGVPDWRVEIAIGMFRASRNGEFAATDPTLERLLGRPPITMREVLSPPDAG